MSESVMVVNATAPPIPTTSTAPFVGGPPLNGHMEQYISMQMTQECENGTQTIRIINWIKDYLDKNENSANIHYWLQRAAYADDRRIRFTSEMLWTNYQHGNTNFKPEDQVNLSGSAFGPLAALYHYIFGNGEPMSVELDQLSFEFTSSAMTPLDRILKSDQIGTFNITNGSFGYDFRKSSRWEWLMLGRISLQTTGTVTIDKGGNWTYNGVVFGTKDIYDANKDPSRGGLGEKLTDILRATNGTSYDIYLKGQREVHMKGKK